MIKGAEAEGPEVEAGVEAEVKVLEWGAGATGEAGAGATKEAGAGVTGEAGIGAGVMDIADRSTPEQYCFFTIQTIFHDISI